MTDSFLCANCREPTTAIPCEHCGTAPLLNDSFKLRRVLGFGAHGTTYLATGLGHQEVAIKELSVRKVQSLKAIELFEREAAALKGLQHKGVPHFIDEFTLEQNRNVDLYLVQEFIEGETLKSDKSRSVDDVVRIGVQLLEILEYLHRQSPPVIHRDIKPSNIIERTDGQIVLIDFGSVKEAIGTSGGSTLVGTAGFAAPETWAGSTNPKSDIYGVGATMIALFTGREPVDLVNPLTREFDWESDVTISKQVADAVNAFVSVDPSTRPKSAREAKRLLTEESPQRHGVLSKVPRPVPEDSSPYVWNEVARRRAIGVSILSALIFLATVIGAQLSIGGNIIGSLIVCGFYIGGPLSLLNWVLWTRMWRQSDYRVGEATWGKIIDVKKISSGWVCHFEWRVGLRHIYGTHKIPFQPTFSVGDTVELIVGKKQTVLANAAQYRLERDEKPPENELSFDFEQSDPLSEEIEKSHEIRAKSR